MGLGMSKTSITKGFAMNNYLKTILLVASFTPLFSHAVSFDSDGQIGSIRDTSNLEKLHIKSVAIVSQKQRLELLSKLSSINYSCPMGNEDHDLAHEMMDYNKKLLEYARYVDSEFDRQAASVLFDLLVTETTISRSKYSDLIKAVAYLDEVQGDRKGEELLVTIQNNPFVFTDRYSNNVLIDDLITFIADNFVQVDFEQEYERASSQEPGDISYYVIKNVKRKSYPHADEVRIPAELVRNIYTGAIDTQSARKIEEILKLNGIVDIGKNYDNRKSVLERQLKRYLQDARSSVRSL